MPQKSIRQALNEAALPGAAELDAVEAEVAAPIDRAVETARGAPPPAEADLYVSY